MTKNRTRFVIPMRPGRLQRWLQHPIAHTTSIGRAGRSIFTWGYDDDGPHGVYVPGRVYELTPLGILNGLFGIAIRIPETREEVMERLRVVTEERNSLRVGISALCDASDLSYSDPVAYKLLCRLRDGDWRP